MPVKTEEQTPQPPPTTLQAAQTKQTVRVDHPVTQKPILTINETTERGPQIYVAVFADGRVIYDPETVFSQLDQMEARSAAQSHLMIQVVRAFIIEIERWKKHAQMEGQ